MYKTQPKKRKYTPKKKLGGITQKYAAKPKTREIKTVDTQITQVYVRVYVPDSLTGLTFNDAPFIQNLARINQGPGIANRIGNKVALKSLRLRGTLQETDNGGTPPIQQARFMVVYDRQPNGAYPSVTNIISDVNTANTVTPGNYLSSLNPNNYDRYIVLCDKLFILGGIVQAGPTTGPTEQKGFVIDEFIKLKGLECQFSTSTVGSPIADLTTGALYMIGIGDLANGAEPFYMDMTCRLRFYDN